MGGAQRLTANFFANVNKRAASSADSEPTSIDAQARIPTRVPISVPYIPVVIYLSLFAQRGTKPTGTSNGLGREQPAACGSRDATVTGHTQSERPTPAFPSKHRYDCRRVLDYWRG